MTLAIVLFVLRIVSALVLLSFLGVIVWLAYKDLRRGEREQQEQYRSYGYLRLIAGDSSEARDDLERRFPLYSMNSIGRASTNTVLLDDEFVSNEHALLTLRGRQWWLTDLNSRNGTMLNGVQLTTATIVSVGDVISIGDIRLIFEPADGA
jgi:hypothetical protein